MTRHPGAIYGKEKKRKIKASKKRIRFANRHPGTIHEEGKKKDRFSGWSWIPGVAGHSQTTHIHLRLPAVEYTHTHTHTHT